MTENIPLYKQAFPHYDDTLPSIQGFEDSSWCNDTCPSLFNRDLQLQVYIDFANPSMRECGQAERYFIMSFDEQDNNLVHIVTNSWAEILAFIETFKQVKNFNEAFIESTRQEQFSMRLDEIRYAVDQAVHYFPNFNPGKDLLLKDEELESIIC